METQNNIALLHRKEWQTMMPAPAATAAGSFVLQDNNGVNNIALFIQSNTVHYLYHHDEDDYVQITSGTFAVALAAGACGTFHPWSVNMTANGGTTTTVTVAAASFNITGAALGKKIRFLTGTAQNIGLERTITAINSEAGIGTITLTLDVDLPAVAASSDTFRIASGSFFVLNAGTLAATNYFKRFDIATQAWSNIGVTGLPATWGTDGEMVSPSLVDTFYDSGTATSGSSTTLVQNTRNWATNQWVNYQVRITAGTGVGQVRVITANNATTLTIAAGATIDNTSQFVIEGDDDIIYIMGNNAVTLYEHSISAGTTSAVSVSAARAAAPSAGMSADFVGVTGITEWASVLNIKNGRYIYCLRGGGSSIIDRYDIPTQAWLPTTGVVYPTTTTFAVGTSTTWDGRYIYIAKEGSATIPQRIYKYSLRGNYLEPVTTDWYLGGAATAGNKLWMKNLSTEGTVKWLYLMQSTSSTLRRIMIY
jgi:hypothetical protein